MLHTHTDRKAADDSNPPVHQIVYQSIREMVLFGELRPGQQVTIQGLANALGSGATPVREAIRRLTAEGALYATDTRRVLVPELDEKLLKELTFARLSIEPELAKMATSRIDVGQIDALEQVDGALDTAIATGDVKGYLFHNYRFHQLLYEQANTEILASIADMLWLRAGPSLRVVCGKSGTENLPDRHEEAISALRRGDPDAVAQAIHNDIIEGHDNIAKSLIVT